MENQIRKKCGLILFLVIAFTVVLVMPCQAEKPTYKAKHNPGEKETQIYLNVVLPEYKINEGAEWMVLKVVLNKS